MAVSFDDAVAYCEWKSRTTGLAWRLPTEEEREKAARGVDGRRFPWGDVDDASLCKCIHSRSETAQMEPVGAFATAASPYGMEDAGGSVWEWTASWFDPARTSRALRGGAWNYAVEFARSAARVGIPPSARSTCAGFRCARSL
jgi:serine/threonine-protein kinase